MTVDVEEWFTGRADHPHELDRFESRLEIGMTCVLDLLEANATRATFFFLGYLAERFPTWVARVAARGHEIAVHGQYHIPLGAMTPTSFRESVIQARNRLLDAGASTVVGFRAPMFSLNASTSWALDVLEELGFEYDSSIFPIHNPRYGYPNAPRLPFAATASGKLMEFPISTARVAGVNLPFAGGFYLRALPLRLLLHAFRRSFSNGEPAVCYVHPWELDPDQPLLPGSLSSRVRHGVGLRTTARKLDRLLHEFDFAPMVDVLRQHVKRPRTALVRLAQFREGPQRSGTGRPHT